MIRIYEIPNMGTASSEGEYHRGQEFVNMGSIFGNVPVEEKRMFPKTKVTSGVDRGSPQRR